VRRDRRSHEFERARDVDREAGSLLRRKPVEHDAEEAQDGLGLHVVADGSARLQRRRLLGDPGFDVAR